MSSLSPAADALRRRSGALRRTARQLDDAEFWSLGASSGADTWTGPTATRFADDLATSRRDLDVAHDELIHAAVRLERTADELEAEARAALVVPVTPVAGSR